MDAEETTITKVPSQTTEAVMGAAAESKNRRRRMVSWNNNSFSTARPDTSNGPTKQMAHFADELTGSDLFYCRAPEICINR